jgi:hypothetical protein
VPHPFQIHITAVSLTSPSIRNLRKLLKIPGNDNQKNQVCSAADLCTAVDHPNRIQRVVDHRTAVTVVGSDRSAVFALNPALPAITGSNNWGL